MCSFYLDLRNGFSLVSNELATGELEVLHLTTPLKTMAVMLLLKNQSLGSQRSPVPRGDCGACTLQLGVMFFFHTI
jgi:hypothetical protein